MGAVWTEPKKIKKKKSFWSVIFSYSMQQQWTNSWLNCDVWQKVDFTYQLAMTSSVIGPRRSLKVLSKTKLAPKKVTITIWWSAASVIHYSFLNSSETITSEKYAQQIDEMHRKLQCLLLALVNRKCPFSMTTLYCMSHKQYSKSWTNLSMKFCLICHIHMTSSQLLTLLQA